MNATEATSGPEVQTPPKTRGLWASLVRWLDAWAPDPRDAERDPREIDWVRVVPFVAIHAGCFLVLAVGWSWFAVWFALGFYVVRMFAITAFYHRYFSHRSFRTSRFVQFCFALLGATAIQRGPLWWAAHHRAHHKHSDEGLDTHSPKQHGFFWSHVGWIMSRGSFRTRLELVPDLARFPELRLLDRFDALVPLAMIPALFGLGVLCDALFPQLGTSGAQLLIWGFCISTVLVYHVTFTVNSIAHLVGTRRFETRDDSRNNFVLALLTFGEGWHNNHHYYPASARQGFRWWEIDASWYALRVLEAAGLVWKVRGVPARVLQQGADR